MSSTFLFYDLETFGLNTRYDRIAQVAAVRTDMDLNIVGPPILLYAKLSPDYLPVPSSCLVTHITPQAVNEKGLPEAEVIGRLREEMMKKDTITLGYNTVQFDDECIRNALYRNLYDPYEREYLNGCSRWDIINLVRATRDLRPEGLIFNKLNDDGFVSFRLTDLTEENNIEQVGAHDALVDVYATVNLAKLIKTKQPKLFSWALNHRGKENIREVIDMVKRTPFLSTSGKFVSERGNTRPLLPLYWANKNDLYCFDLTYPIPSTVELNNYAESGIYRLSVNKCPFVAPLSTLSAGAEKRLGFTKKEVLEKAEKVLRSSVFKAEDFTVQYEQSSPDLDPDLSIYGSFLSRDDKLKLEEIRKLSPKEKLMGERTTPFDNPKYHKLVWRHVARNWPEVLDDREKVQWRNWCSQRLVAPLVKDAQSIDDYLYTCNELLNSLNTDGDDKKVVLSLIEYAEYLKKTIVKPEKV